jgi:multidrug resistance efflux pump
VGDLVPEDHAVSADPQTALREAQTRLDTAEKAARLARRDIEDAHRALGDARRAEALEREPAMSVDELREAIADAAREHGSECANQGGAHTSLSWVVFRALLARLAARASR